jgi:lysylphosphatidylglycerol synthetase-like protein (DUF2156 family)
VYTAGTLLHGIGSIRSDTDTFVSEHPFLAIFISNVFPDFRSGTQQAIDAIKRAAVILLICGLVGAIASVLFWSRRFGKALPIALIVCGAAPMFHHPLEFVGLPISLAGVIALLISRKTMSPAAR